MTMIDFGSINLNRLFGSLAAEDDNQDNLKNYFLKTSVYNRLIDDDKVTIVQGYKGTGKSAMLKMAYNYFEQKDIFCMWLRPDEFPMVRMDNSINTSNLIAKWKDDLRGLIVEKAYNYYLNEERPEKKVFNTINAITDMFTLGDKTPIKANIDEIKKKISEKFLNEKQVYIFIDDLDNLWDASLESRKKISSLISAIRSLSNDDKGLNFRLSLRSDMYFLLRASDSNLDKIKGNIVNINWSQNDLWIVLIRRVQFYLNGGISEKEFVNKGQNDLDIYLKDIMELRFKGKGKWHNRPIHQILLSMIRERPRDLINLCLAGATEAAKNEHTVIQTSDWENIFRPYSIERFNDTIIEHRLEFNGEGVSELLNAMKTTRKEANNKKNKFNYDELFQKVNNVLSQKHITNNSKTVVSTDEAMEFLYRIGFFVARKQSTEGFIDRRGYIDDPNLIKQKKGYEFEIHPAFRWALNYNDDNEDDFIDERY